MKDGNNAGSMAQKADVDQQIDRFLSASENFRPLYLQFQQIEERPRLPVSVVQTHCARLYLSGDFVVKIKRPVAYSYLNLTSLSKRRHVCERELVLNKPSLPNIYLGVAALVESSSGELAFAFDTVAISNTETIKEWCLLMRRFDEDCVLDNVATRDQFDIGLAKQTGHAIAAYHDALPIVSCDDSDIRVDELISELEFELKLLDQVFPKERVVALVASMYQRFREVKAQLSQRSEEGFVRRCHGDLHLRNLLLLDGRPVPFDALEFDERLATTDVLYDLAFLIMDLCHRDLVPQANAVLNEYLLESDERNISGLALLDLFISIRAAIRAMTTAQSLTAAGSNNTGSDLQEPRREALSYLELAENALEPKKAMVVAVGGFSGSGKSTFAKALATQISTFPGALLLNSDVERKAEFNVESSQKLDVDHYTSANSDRVYDRLLKRMSHAIAIKYPVIVDATFLTAKRRDQLEELVANKPVEFFGFWLMAPVEVMRNRIDTRRGDVSDADIQVLEKQLALDKGPNRWQHLDTNAPVDRIVENICRSIEQASMTQAFSASDSNPGQPARA